LYKAETSLVTTSLHFGDMGKTSTIFMKQSSKVYISLSIEAQKALFVDVYHRSTIEACGVLLGTMDEQGNWHVEQAHPLRNIFASPVYFEFAPEDLLMVEMEHPDGIIGVYHSHPTGFANASSTDRENMKRVNKEQCIPWVWCIIRGPFTDASAEGRIALSSIVAYHHFEKEGLQRVPVVLEATSSDKTIS